MACADGPLWLLGPSSLSQHGRRAVGRLGPSGPSPWCDGWLVCPALWGGREASTSVPPRLARGQAAGWPGRRRLLGCSGVAHCTLPQDPLSSLERELALQLQIAEAARRLCREGNLDRQARRQRKHAVQQEETKLRELQRCLGEWQRGSGAPPALAPEIGRASCRERVSSPV